MVHYLTVIFCYYTLSTHDVVTAMWEECLEELGGNVEEFHNAWRMENGHPDCHFNLCVRVQKNVGFSKKYPTHWVFEFYWILGFIGFFI